MFNACDEMVTSHCPTSALAADCSYENTSLITVSRTALVALGTALFLRLVADCGTFYHLLLVAADVVVAVGNKNQFPL